MTLVESLKALLDNEGYLDVVRALDEVITDYGIDVGEIFPHHDDPKCESCGYELDCPSCNPQDNECNDCGDYHLRCMNCEPIEELPQPAVTSYTGRSAFA